MTSQWPHDHSNLAGSHNVECSLCRPALDLFTGSTDTTRSFLLSLIIWGFSTMSYVMSLSGFYEDLNMIATIGTSDQPCWLTEACQIRLHLLLVCNTRRRWSSAKSSIKWCQVSDMLSTSLQLHTRCLCIAGGMCWGVAQCSVVRPLLALCAAAATATDAHVYNRHRSCCQVHSVCALSNDVLHVTPYIASQTDLCCNGCPCSPYYISRNLASWHVAKCHLLCCYA